MDASRDSNFDRRNPFSGDKYRFSSGSAQSISAIVNAFLPGEIDLFDETRSFTTNIIHLNDAKRGWPKVDEMDGDSEQMGSGSNVGFAVTLVQRMNQPHNRELESSRQAQSIKPPKTIPVKSIAIQS